MPTGVIKRHHTCELSDQLRLVEFYMVVIDETIYVPLFGYDDIFLPKSTCYLGFSLSYKRNIRMLSAW
jgi:hypothetical protein